MYLVVIILVATLLSFSLIVDNDLLSISLVFNCNEQTTILPGCTDPVACPNSRIWIIFGQIDMLNILSYIHNFLIKIWMITLNFIEHNTRKQ